MTRIINHRRILIVATLVFIHSTSQASMNYENHLNDVKHQPIDELTQPQSLELPLRRIRIKGDELKALATRLKALGYEVLEDSIDDISFEVIVDDKQFGQLLRAQALDIDVMAVSSQTSAH